MPVEIDVVRARVTTELKNQATDVLHRKGLTMSDGIKMFLMSVVAEQDVPVLVNFPNKTTLKAMQAAEEGKVSRVKNVRDIIND